MSATPIPGAHLTDWRGRRAYAFENGVLRAVFLPGGGHLASLAFLDGPAKAINPLWEVPWESIEPDEFRPVRDLDRYGGPPEARLLASIMGHNLCLDYFGGPSAAEEDAGLTVHGEASVAAWEVEPGEHGLTATAELPYARLWLKRTISPAPGAAGAVVTTEVENEAGESREIGWQEHATFGPPFLEKGETVFDASATAGRTNPATFARKQRLGVGADFTWPRVPRAAGGDVDLRLFPADEASGDFTTQLMDSARPTAWVTAVNPRLGLLCGYLWHRADFPWLGMWDENLDRLQHPWDGRTLARGMEFGLSPFPQGKEAMRTLGSLFGTPTLATLRAGETRRATWRVFLAPVPAGCAGVADVTGAPDAGPVTITLRGGVAVRVA
jgi:hypothetical protein